LVLSPTSLIGSVHPTTLDMAFDRLVTTPTGGESEGNT
jgi:hypothetical protein